MTKKKIHVNKEGARPWSKLLVHLQRDTLVIHHFPWRFVCGAVVNLSEAEGESSWKTGLNKRKLQMI